MSFLITFIFCLLFTTPSAASDRHTYCVLEDEDGGDPSIAITFAPGRGVLFDINNKEFFVEEQNMSIDPIGDGIIYRLERKPVKVSEQGKIGPKEELEADIRMLMDFDRFSMQLHYVLGADSACCLELFCFEQYPQF